MPIFYRRPGVYLEESLLINPVDVAGTITVSAFVGVSPKGPPNTPILISSWSDYVTIFGGFDLIQPPIHDPNDVTSENLPDMTFPNLAALKADTTVGDGRYIGSPFVAGQYVTLGDNTKNHYNLPAKALNRNAAQPNQMFTADADITASDATNAAKLAATGSNEVQTITGTGTPTGGTYTLTFPDSGVTTAAIAYNAAAAAVKTAIDTAWPGNTITVGGGPLPVTPMTLTYTGMGNVSMVTVTASLTGGTTPAYTPAVTTAGVGEGFVATPTSAWTTGQNIWVGAHAFYWNGTAWAAGTSGGGTPNANNGVWASGAMTGTPATLPDKPPLALSYLPYQVYSFFQNGGRFAWIVRAISSDPEIDGIPATISVNGTVSGQASMKAFDMFASSVGVWGNSLSYILIKQSQTPAGEPPVQDVFAIQVLMRNAVGQDEVIETFSNMSISGRIAGTRRVDSVINDPAAGSRYLRVKGLNPVQLTLDYSAGGAVPLIGGVDPGLPDAVTLEEASRFLDKVEGPVNLNVASYIDDASYLDTAQAPLHTVGATVDPRTMFPDREDVFAFNDNAPPRTENQSSAAYMSLLTSGPLVTGNNSYCASYAPWIIVPHPVQPAATIAIPPGGAVMGVCARVDATIGVHRAPAGVIAGIENAIGCQTKFTDTELGTLNSSNINIIRSIIGSGICIMGARTRKGYGPDRYISARRVLINLKEQLRRSTQYAVFENNDERLWSSMRVTGHNILRPMWEQGGLRGTTQSQAYYVKCDADLNTPQVIASGEVRMEIGVALEYPAEFVIIKLTQISGTQFTNEIQVA